jgi:hypothetical protein
MRATPVSRNHSHSGAGYSPTYPGTLRDCGVPSAGLGARLRTCWLRSFIPPARAASPSTTTRVPVLSPVSRLSCHLDVACGRSLACTGRRNGEMANARVWARFWQGIACPYVGWIVSHSYLRPLAFCFSVWTKRRCHPTVGCDNLGKFVHKEENKGLTSIVRKPCLRRHAPVFCQLSTCAGEHMTGKCKYDATRTYEGVCIPFRASIPRRILIYINVGRPLSGGIPRAGPVVQ